MRYYLKISMKDFLISLFLTAILNGCDSQSNKPKNNDEQQIDLIEYCKTHECRKDLKFRVRTPDDTYFEYSTKFSVPVVQEKIDESDSGDKRTNYLVTIFPGETIYVAFDPGTEGPENMRSVSSSDNSSNSLTIKLTQEENIANGLGMKLSIHNSSRFYIKYWLFVQKIKDNTSSKVSSCPLKPESISYETWQDPVFQIHMGKFIWTDETDLECE